MKDKLELSGCFTALLTPVSPGLNLDFQGFERNVAFQLSQGVSGLVPAGTTGGSPTLSPEEHNDVNSLTAELVDDRAYVLAGTGSNSLQEAMTYTEVAEKAGCPGVLLVDSYYNGPSSLELRKEYYGYLAKRHPKITIVPYIIPGRTGCELSVPDLAWLAWTYPNLRAVKEATGNLERMAETRRLTPEGFAIFSGDDNLTRLMMLDSGIKACGAISVTANFCPAAVQQLCDAIIKGETECAEALNRALSPLFDVVTVKAKRMVKIPPGIGEEFPVEDKFRNPVALNTIMNGLGMPAGPCRAPLGKMTSVGVTIVRDALRCVWRDNPELLRPIEEFYKVDISKRLADDGIWDSLAYR